MKVPLILLINLFCGLSVVFSQQTESVQSDLKPNFQSVPADGVLLLGTDANGNFVNRFKSKDSPLYPDWTVKDNTLVSTQGTGPVRANHIYSDFIFKDALIHAEFLIPGQGAGNSGLYIHGEYEVQIINSHLEKKLDNSITGAVYHIAAPTVNIALTPEQWQSYDITFMAPRRNEQGVITDKGKISVILNGVEVVHQAELDEPVSPYTPFKRGNTPELTPIYEHQMKTSEGPLFLQDHDAPVQFRNIWIKPIK